MLLSYFADGRQNYYIVILSLYVDLMYARNRLALSEVVPNRCVDFPKLLPTNQATWLLRTTQFRSKGYTHNLTRVQLTLVTLYILYSHTSNIASKSWSNHSYFSALF